MFQNIIYFVLSIIAAVIAWWFYFTSTRFYKLCIEIPGPKPLPIIGNIELLKNRKMAIQNGFKLLEKYPKICRVFVGSMCFVGLTDANEIYKVLNSSKTLSKSRLYAPVRLVLGVNLLTAQREDWRRYRKILKPGFNTKVIRNYIDIFNEKSMALVKMWSSRNYNLKFDVYETLLMATLDMITKSSSGTDLRVLENDNTEIPSTIAEGRQIIQECILSPVHWFEIIYKHSNFSKRASNILKLDRQFLEPIKQDLMKKSEIKSYEDINFDEKNEMRMLDYILLFINKSKMTFIEAEMMDQIRMLGLAGSETTAFTLSVCLMLLGLYKDVQDKVVEELHDIFCDDINRSAEYDDLQRMTYTEQVIKETLRLFPVAYLTGRRVDEEIEIGEYLLPAGTDIIISPYLLHRNPKYFPDPLKFDPDRFTPENISTRNPHCFIPFFTGPRNCIGNYYAMIQMKTVLSHLLRHFEIIPCSSREEMEDVDMQIMLHLKHGYNVRIKMRNL